MFDDNTFKHDYDFVMPAVQENGFAFVLAGNAFKRDHDFETAALELILYPDVMVLFIMDASPLRLETPTPKPGSSGTRSSVNPRPSASSSSG